MHNEPVDLLRRTIEEALNDGLIMGIKLGEWSNAQLRAHVLAKLIPTMDKIIVAEGRPVYDEHYGDDRVCECGHPYYRHFDTYYSIFVGCKYCQCHDFEEAPF